MARCGRRPAACRPDTCAVPSDLPSFPSCRPRTRACGLHGPVNSCQTAGWPPATSATGHRPEFSAPVIAAYQSSRRSICRPDADHSGRLFGRRTRSRRNWHCPRADVAGLITLAAPLDLARLDNPSWRSTPGRTATARSPAGWAVSARNSVAASLWRSRRRGAAGRARTGAEGFAKGARRGGAERTTWLRLGRRPKAAVSTSSGQTY